MKVFMVTAGGYSDYHVEGIFSTREKAQEYIDFMLNQEEYFNFNDIDEIEVDNKYNFFIRDQHQTFTFYMDIDGNTNHSSASLDVSCRDENMYAHEYMLAGVQEPILFIIKSKTLEHAINIANQKRIELISNNLFVPCDWTSF